MNIQPSIVALLALTMSVHARLGENMDQLIARYGSRPKVKLVRGGEVWTFTTPTLIVTIDNGGFARPVSVIERFTKRDGTPFTEDEVMEMTKPIAQPINYNFPHPTVDDLGGKRWEVVANRIKAKGIVISLSPDALTMTIEPMPDKRQESKINVDATSEK